jgi:Na+:H+ antiporter, NhaA family
LAFGLAVLGILLLMRVLGVQTVGYYLPWALMFWFAILESGIHPTIAGVVLGLLTPTGPYLARADFAALARPLVHTIGEIPSEGDGEKAEATLGQLERLTVATESPADRVVRVLHPWSSYLVLPVFALANAGVHLTAGVAEHVFWNPVFRGIFLGLVAGKVAGICLFALLATRLRVATRLPVAGWTQMCGIGLLGGIGFTVALFITDLAFSSPTVIGEAKLAVLLASLLAGILGYAVLHIPIGQSGPSLAKTKGLCRGE